MEEGMDMQLIQMVLRKLQKNKSPELIASELDEEPDTVLYICEAADTCQTVTDAEKVYQYLDNLRESRYTRTNEHRSIFER